MVAGVIVVAVAVRLAIEAPSASGSAAVTATMLGGPAIYLGGLALGEADGLLRTSYRRLRRTFEVRPMILCDDGTTRARSPKMTIIARTLAGLAFGALGLLAAAGAYAETHRAPDQP